MDELELNNILVKFKSGCFKSELNNALIALGSENVSLHDVDAAGEIFNQLIKVVRGTKEAPILKDFFENTKEELKKISQNSENSSELRAKSFEVLFKILPFCVDICYVKPIFPAAEYSELLGVIISAHGDLTCLINVLQHFLEYKDMRINFWKALEITIRKHELDQLHVQNSLNLISTVATKSEKPNENDFGPVQYYCGVKIGVINNKESGKCVQRIWERLSAVEVPVETRLLLLRTLLEKMIFRMDRPIFLTDYFMSSLQFGGPVGILGLQGIFTLIQKFNINHPHVYERLYQMLNTDIFNTYYKSRLFFLTDVFLSSLHLPETLVAGFAKRMARLSLVAPPTDILILLALITNLIIRHSGLNKLITNMGTNNYENDPYIASESDPSMSKALESSLWEIKVLQQHVLPNVSAAAMFIEQPLPSIERNIPELLDCCVEQMFVKETKKKFKDPAVSFESPKLREDEELTFWDLNR